MRRKALQSAPRSGRIFASEGALGDLWAVCGVVKSTARACRYGRLGQTTKPGRGIENAPCLPKRTTILGMLANHAALQAVEMGVLNNWLELAYSAEVAARFQLDVPTFNVANVPLQLVPPPGAMPQLLGPGIPASPAGAATFNQMSQGMFGALPQQQQLVAPMASLTTATSARSPHQAADEAAHGMEAGEIALLTWLQAHALLGTLGMAASPRVGVSTADRNYLPSLVFCVVRSVAARPLRARRSLCFPPARPVFRVCSLALPLSARRLRAARVVFLLHNPMVINHTTSASTSQPNTHRLCTSCVHNWRYGWCAPGSAPPYPHLVLCVRFTDEI